MRKVLIGLLLYGVFFIVSPVWAAVGIIYVDTAGNGGVTTDSGTTNNSNASLATCTVSTNWSAATGCTGTAASWTTGTNTITLDTNTLLTNMPVNGSQAIFLTNATNTNDKIFWITGITGCTGSGSCTVTISINATCATCTAQTWVIGGRVALPDASLEGALRAGDTISVNTSISCATPCVTLRVAGDTVTGPITIKPTTTPVTLTASASNQSIIVNSGTQANWHFGPGLTFTGSAATPTVALVVPGNGSNIAFDSDTFTANATPGTVNCLTSTSQNLQVTNSIFTLCGGDAISMSQNNFVIMGNLFSGTFNGNAITMSSATPSGLIEGNIIIGDATALCAINQTGTITSTVNSLSIMHNTIVNWRTGGLCTSASAAFLGVKFFNNIFYNDNLTSGANVAFPASSAADTSILAGAHGCNVFFAASGTNLTNVVANAVAGQADVATTSGTLFGTGFGLAFNSIAQKTGCYQNPGTYATDTNNLDIGALQSEVGGSNIMGGGL